MTTINPFAAGSYTATRNTQQILALKDQLNTLTTQLGTGRASETYAGLGAGRSTSLSARATLSALSGYDAAITAAQTRTNLVATSLSQVIDLGNGLSSNLRNGLVRESNGTVSSTTLARNSLAAVFDALNQSTGGTYVFGGRNGETAPVVGYDLALNGNPALSLDGLKTLVAQQRTADIGKDGLGRLALTQPSATSVSLGENASAAVRANFGFTLPKAPTVTGSALTAAYTPATAATATATFAAAPTDGQRFRVVVNQPDGSQKSIDFTTRAAPRTGDTDTFPVVADPAAAKAALDGLIAPGTIASVQSAATTDTPPGPGLTLAFGGGSPASLTVGLGTPARNPAAGDSVTVQLALHDGTSTTITLTAKSAAGATGATDFAIDPADPAKTAANLAAALNKAVGSAASSTLGASATVRASQDFFAGSTAPGLAPRRLTFDADGNATGYAQRPQANTVIWYQGEDSGSDPRDSLTARIGTSSNVSIGARANEGPLRSVLAGMAAAAIGMPSGSDDSSWQALADRSVGALNALSTSPSVQEIATDFGLAASSLSNAKSINTATRSTLQDTVESVESAPMEEVAAKLLAVQNRLQASYQITSTLAKLSLVNYMG